MKRSFDPAVLEMMDRPQPVSPELERDLQRLRQLNRWFGSYRLVLKFMRHWIKPGARLRVVDLATGSGDISRLLVDFARNIGAYIEVDAVDRQSATVQIAMKLSAGYPEISFHEANILGWDCAQGYDVALCSLVLHHFSDEDAVAVLKRCRELSKRWVLVSDLRRGTDDTFRRTAFCPTRIFIFRDAPACNSGRLAKFRPQTIPLRKAGNLG
jgi:2-polyprenyl-3-methyl-5-hydroxy-6-metoxy-1,4-benzoquinol methylase